MEVAWIAHHYHAAVVRHVEPLVRIDRPRVGGGVALHEMRAGGRRRRPEPERPVHVYPGARRFGPGDDLVGGIECAGVDVACLETKNRIVVQRWQDRKSTRLNSSHVKISYAVFCLKQKIQNY